MIDLDWEIKTSDRDADPEWDAFVASTDDGHHVQTSSWARIKSSLGWKSKRILVFNESKIIGGVQLLIRSIPLFGKLGYITKGPLLKLEDQTLSEQIIEKILNILYEENCQLLAIQPPNSGDYICKILKRNNFQLSTLELTPTASLVLDLHQGEDLIFQNLHKKTRQHIRQSERAGTIVKEGTFADLDVFYELHLSTSQRHRFTPYKREYFNILWENLAPFGWIKLLIAWNEKPLSALIFIPFGNTIITKLSGWTGKDPELYPNEAMHWAAIKWGIDHGYKYFDFEGIDPGTARLLIDGGKLDKSQNGFKSGFGGEPVLYPPAYDNVPNKFFNWFYRRVPPVMYGDSLMSKTLERIRKR